VDSEQEIVANIEIKKQSKTGVELIIRDEWTKGTLQNALSIEKTITHIHEQSVVFDFVDTVALDSAGIVEVIRISNLLLQRGCTITFVNMNSDAKRLLIFYRNNFIKKIKIKKRRLRLLEDVGRYFADFIGGVVDFLSFLGETSLSIFLLVLFPLRFRYKALIKHIDHSGTRALPIITLTSFLVGLVIAYQGSGQLVKFGANIFIVDMSCMSVFRELAPMITAIVVAGRSASSYTAEIGTMKITEEVDAMRTMGFDPFVFLVIPRLVALIICMPLVIFAADIIGVFGAMLVAKFNLGISFSEFIARMQAEVPIKHLFVGLAKAPMYGIIISIIGCYRGFQVSGSTDSIGNYTTKSVVDAIFWIIVSNALIAIMLTEMGI
jgi:phospholipid/cholesterol/gamma-HCH transport system permease protein